MNAANYFYFSVGTFAIIGTVLAIAISVQIFLAVRQFKEILRRLNDIKKDAQIAREKIKLGFLELIGFFVEKIKKNLGSEEGGD